MKQQTLRRLTFAALVALLLAAVPTFAQNQIDAGLDAWHTPTGGAEIDIAIPAGLFCGGTSSGFIANDIKFKGVPLTTSPQLSNVDTIISRDTAYFNGGNTATADIRILALSLESTTDVTVNCGSHSEVWRVLVGLVSANSTSNTPGQVDGTITFYRSGPSGGTFQASFPVNAELTFVNAASPSQRVGPINQVETVTTASSPWVFSPPSTAQPTPGDSVEVDLDGDGILDDTGLETGPNFWPNGPVEHDGPHPNTCLAPGSGCPVRPDPGCDEPDVVAALQAAAVPGVGFVFEEHEEAQEAEAGEIGGLGAKSFQATATRVDKATLDKSVRDICVAVVGRDYLAVR